MKGAFIVYGAIKEEKADGIQKKILSQIRAFNKNGLPCEMKCIPKGDERCGLIMAGLISLFPRMNWLPIWGRAEEYKKYDYLYFRRPPAMSFAMRKFLREVKKQNPNVRIIMEVPTYPYDGEMQSLAMKPFLWKDRYNRKKMAGLVDALAIISEKTISEDVWGIPVISFKNGYDVGNAKPAKHPLDHNCINMCCVAIFQPWHGYERLLLGLEQYYKKGGSRKIICHMIGDGGEVARYKRIAKSKWLEDKVIFYGRQSGKKLDSLYDKMDIGVCSLGSYKRKDLGDISSELKSREYMSKGLPIVIGGKLDVSRGKSLDFIFEVENDGSVLDIDQTVKFYDRIRQNEKLRSVIREFAFQTIDISRTMKPVVDYIRAEGHS